MSFNKNFKMGLGEIDVIEDWLRHRLNWLSEENILKMMTKFAFPAKWKNS
jgi:hypothetical protein